MTIEFINTALAASEVHTEAETSAEISAPKAETHESTQAAEHEPQGVAGTLGIDGIYFIGQLITFSLVLFILWKFVFGPVAQKLTERADKVEKAMLDADRIAKEKQEFETWKNEQMTRARKEAGEIVTNAQSEANKLKDQTLILTKRDQEKIIEQTRNQMETEKNKAMAEAKSEIANMVTMATEKIIKQKMDSHKDQEMVKDVLKSI